MKNLKIKATSAALLLTLFAVNASAQPQQRRAPRGGEKLTAEKIAEINTDKLDQVLELTDEQEMEIYSINLKYAQETQANKPERTERPERPEAGKGKEEGKADRSKRPEANKEEGKSERSNREQNRADIQAQQKAQMVEIIKVLTDDQKIDYVCYLTRVSNGRHNGGSQGQRGGNKGRQGAQQSRGGQDPKGQGSKGEEPQGGRGPQRGGERTQVSE